MLSATDINSTRTGPKGAAPVVLLHSAGLDLTFWDVQIEALRHEYDVVALDLPGHGRSRARAADIDIETLCAALATAIADLGAGPVHLIGLSVGGLLAQSIALDRPDLVRSLVLIDTAACFSAAGQTAMRERATTVRRSGMAAILPDLFGHWFMPETSVQRPHLVDRATKVLLRDDPDVHAALWEMIAAFDVSDRLKQITTPTLVLVGEHDASSPVSSAQQLRDAIVSARLHIIPGAAHLSAIESPALVTDQIRRFLSEVNA
jgi:3-oxoadipate enol-lactonase